MVLAVLCLGTSITCSSRLSSKTKSKSFATRVSSPTGYNYQRVPLPKGWDCRKGRTVEGYHNQETMGIAMKGVKLPKGYHSQEGTATERVSRNRKGITTKRVRPPKVQCLPPVLKRKFLVHGANPKPPTPLPPTPFSLWQQ